MPWACGTACHSKFEADYVASTVAQKIFGYGRETPSFLKGFPNFDAAASELQQAANLPQPTYEVCIPLPNGDLAIQENLVELWSTKHDMFQRETQELLEEHNKKYNPRGVKRSLDHGGSGTGGSVEGRDAKKIRIDDVVKASDHEANIAEKPLGVILFAVCLLCLLPTCFLKQCQCRLFHASNWSQL